MANTDIEIFVALFEEGNREGGLMQELDANGWELTSEFLEFQGWSNKHKLNKVWTKNAAAGTTISFQSTSDSLTFSILATKGMILNLFPKDYNSIPMANVQLFSSP